MQEPQLHLTDPRDVQFGQTIRARRREIGMSQVQLAKAIGVTFQQVQKYERGANRVSVSRLLDIAKALRVSTSYLFAGLEPGVPAADPRARALMEDARFMVVTDQVADLPEPHRKAAYGAISSLITAIAEVSALAPARRIVSAECAGAK